MISFKFDFARGDFEIVDGKVAKITDLELIKNQIEKLLRTEFDRYKIYTAYGMLYHNWIYGQRDRELVRIAMTRELSERIPDLLEGVIRVYDIALEFERHGARISLSVETEYTEGEELKLWITF